jgi:dihydrofolate reductase
MTEAVQTPVQSSKKLNLIWAQTTSGVIGNENAIPWHLPEDQKHFRALTKGHSVIMGRRTWESLPERFRPLPGRTNIVVSRQEGLEIPGALVTNSLDAALELVPTEQEAWVIGGGQIYAEALERASKIVVTYIDLSVDGDAKAPVFSAGWEIVDCKGWLKSETGIRYRIATATRIGSEESKLNVCSR